VQPVAAARGTGELVPLHSQEVTVGVQ
jgi:hypothetical protein